jgi:hypothetical protein
MSGIVRYGAPSAMAAFIDAADPIYGTGADGNADFDGTSTVLGLVPSSSVYSLTADIFCNNLTVRSGVRVAPNGYRIFVKNILQMENNSTIGFTTGYSTAGSIMQGGAASTAVTHSLGGSATGFTATAPTAAQGGSKYYTIPHQAVKGYAVTAPGGPFMLRGGAGGVGQAGGGVVVIATRYFAAPSSGTAYIKAPGTAPAGGGVILIVSTHSALPGTISTDVTGQNPGTVNYMQLV